MLAVHELDSTGAAQSTLALACAIQAKLRCSAVAVTDGNRGALRTPHFARTVPLRGCEAMLKVHELDSAGVAQSTLALACAIQVKLRCSAVAVTEGSRGA